MNLDARIATKARPMFGCHSDLDRTSKREPFECEFSTRETEKACDGCERKVGAGGTALEGYNAELRGRPLADGPA